MSTPISIAWKSLVVAVVVLALKALAAWWSGSVALFSDAVESIVNVATALVVLAAIVYAARPADAGHPYGHEKAEYFVAMIEAVLIGAAAFAILSEAWQALTSDHVVDVPGHAVAVAVVAAAINGIWSYVLIARGRELRSAALTADGWHLFADVLSTAGVLVGAVLASVTGIVILDPLLAIAVALHILWSGWRILKSSIDGLMDSAPDSRTIELIRTAIASEGGGAIQAHDLKARQAGPVTFIEFHLVVNGEISVREAHDICDRIETALTERLSNSQITIHVEPETKSKSRDSIAI